jgi:hypothetical protein
MKKLIHFNYARIRNIILCVYACFAVLIPANAQNTSSAPRMNRWHFLVEPYLMMASINGSVGIGNIPATNICIPASEVFSHLNFGAMLYAEARNERFAISSDFLYASLDQGASSKNGIINGQAGVKLVIEELAGLYRVAPWLEFGLGARIVGFETSLDVNVDSTIVSGTHHRSASKSTTWVDPILITRLMGTLHKKWILQLRADAGGIGIGSQFTWQIHPIVTYKFSKLFQLGLGYRMLSFDYNKGSGTDQVVYDMDLYGPEFRVGFNF